MHDASELQIRRQAWWLMTLGAFGQVMGNDPLFWFGPGWRRELDSPCARVMTAWRAFWEALPWWDLVPDLEGRLLVGGLGEWNGLDRATAAMTADGSLAVVYIPERRRIWLDLSALRGPSVGVRWVEPATDASIDETRHEGSGIIRLDPPCAPDAALVLRSLEA